MAPKLPPPPLMQAKDTILARWCSDLYQQIKAGLIGGSSSPLTTKGGLITHDATADVQLAVGSDGEVLTADSTQPDGIKWAALPAAPVTSVAGKTGAVTLVEGDITNLTTDLAAKLTNPMNTKGDIIVADTGGTPTRVAAGPVGYAVISNGPGAAPSYQSVGTLGLPLWLQQHPDSYPTSPNAADDEFDGGAINTSLWTALNANAGMPFTQANGRLVASPNNGGGAVRGYWQGLPGSGSWEYRAKVHVNPWQIATFSELTGIWLIESSTGKLVSFYIGRLASPNFWLVYDKWTSSGTVFGSRASTADLGVKTSPPLYIKITFDTTTYNFYWSYDGVAFFPFVSRAATTDFTVKADRIGPAVICDYTSAENPVYWEFFRRTV